jgi:hypothetical protein
MLGRESRSDGRTALRERARPRDASSESSRIPEPSRAVARRRRIASSLGTSQRPGRAPGPWPLDARAEDSQGRPSVARPWRAGHGRARGQGGSGGTAGRPVPRAPGRGEDGGGDGRAVRRGSGGSWPAAAPRPVPTPPAAAAPRAVRSRPRGCDVGQHSREDAAEKLGPGSVGPDAGCRVNGLGVSWPASPAERSWRTVVPQWPPPGGVRREDAMIGEQRPARRGHQGGSRALQQL